MCSLILLLRAGHPWPVLIAANRDEMLDRPWEAPGRHWPEKPEIVAGRDTSGGGTWLGMNGQGVAVAVLNRMGSLGPAPGKRSRGGIPLLALDAATAADAAGRLGKLDAEAYRPFNAVVADASGGFFLRGLGTGPIEVTALPQGITMVTAHDPNDLTSPRIARYLPQFAQLSPPDPDSGDWSAWTALLADRAPPAETSLNVAPRGGFGTVCSSLIALSPGRRLWRFAPGPPGEAEFAPVETAAPL